MVEHMFANINLRTITLDLKVVTSSSHKVCWVHGVNPYMYVSLGHQVLKCHHGTDKNKKKKMEKEKTKTFSSEQHSYAKKKTRHALQPSKKMDCPASIILKEVLIFTPEEGSSRELDKKMAASNVRSDLSKGIKKIMVVFPNVEHKYHTSGENAGLLQRIDSDVASKIKELVVEDGVANVEEMQRHLTSFVTKNVTPAPSKTNRRFAPTKKVIRYHMNKAAKNGCDSSDDQHNLVQLRRYPMASKYKQFPFWWGTTNPRIRVGSFQLRGYRMRPLLHQGGISRENRK
ncbi:uncharacterized protein LOC127864704 isoform X3 [Dreissena polymorpha]|uniref:uncharacterized protein LOC127864704 isoform X2 n=1 Tax=Dreissena polymorpha TaxID=45954 RepID=UPI002263ED13|nr:uncharacterized protein LOC127864704 isoform X2 [Dreissena polymorpha]XP_052260554.1 uncharacterized protein LOC127864704 isoform X3 [Dreissena polymorpha]